MRLFDLLQGYSESGSVRFHMPGHKGRDFFKDDIYPYPYDITEIPDFDDLHHPEGVIKDLQNNIASLYGVKKAELLVNGSTVGILAAVFSMIEENEKVLLARNSHKSIYNALMLRKAEPVFFNIGYDEKGITEPINEAEIEKKLNDNPNIKLAIITSPTYEGVVQNIKDIKSLLKKYDIPLLVDAAHGAHLGISEDNYPHPIKMGADIAVTSLHKTLPFLTQTSALLYSADGEKFKKKVEYYLHCFETSSPSYILLGSAEYCIGKLLQKKDIAFKEYYNVLEDFYKGVQEKDFKYVRLINKPYMDKTKINIAVEGGNPEDIRLLEEVLNRHKVIPEMTTENYILCLSTLADKKEDFSVLTSALEDADSLIGEKGYDMPKKSETTKNKSSRYFHIPKRSFLPKYVENAKYIPIDEAKGKVCGDFIFCYPPGIPIIIPGEIIDEDVILLVKRAKELNNNIRGLKGDLIPIV